MIAFRQQVQRQPERTTFQPLKLLKFPGVQDDVPPIPAEELTLSVYYKTMLLPDLEDLAPRSLKEDRIALNHWIRLVGDPPLSAFEDPEFGNDCLQTLMAGMADRSAATINKTWREIKGIFQAACDDSLCDRMPVLLKRRKGKRITSRLIKEAPKVQREVVTEQELESLWRACDFATYPRRTQFSAPKMWRVAEVLFWTYGARTEDFLRHLRWDHVRFHDRILKFTAQKTSKLQGLPLTDIVIEHLRSIKGHSDRVFPGFNSPGCYLHKTKEWKRGFRATWRSEICANSEIHSPITLKHFRERVLTTYNARHSGLGNWILAHYMPGVSAQNYDLPTDQIREQICSAPVPKCFEEIG